MKSLAKICNFPHIFCIAIAKSSVCTEPKERGNTSSHFGVCMVELIYLLAKEWAFVNCFALILIKALSLFSAAMDNRILQFFFVIGASPTKTSQ